jgi:hypothetical protein
LKSRNRKEARPTTTRIGHDRRKRLETEIDRLKTDDRLK